MISIPFPGSKRYSYKQVKEIVQAGDYEEVFEPFGGSCVLSVNLYNDQLVKRAVVNDYDRFFDLYPEYLDLKDKVVQEGLKRGLRRTTYNKKYGVIQFELDGTRTPAKSDILSDEHKQILQDIISEYVPEKYWRYFAYGSNFTFSARSCSDNLKLQDFIKFDRYLASDKQRNYLKVLEQVQLEHLDWLDFLNKHEESIRNSKSLLILDPPYIGTYQKQYKGQFTEEETIQLINKAVELNCDFIFFNHNQEQVEEWLKGLNYTIQFTGNLRSTANRNRKDVMAYVMR